MCHYPNAENSQVSIFIYENHFDYKKLTISFFSHPNALVRAATARLMAKMVEIHGASKVLALSKDKKDAVLSTAVKFLMDGNLETR